MPDNQADIIKANNLLFQQIRDFDFPLGEYVLFGSAPMGIRGWRVSHDLDIVVSEALYQQCRKSDWQIKVMDDSGNEYLHHGDIDLYRDWSPGQWDAEELIARAEVIDGLPFARLESVLAWKKMANREKDQEDIKAIENFLFNSADKR